jgi:hypothetical protein
MTTSRQSPAFHTHPTFTSPSSSLVTSSVLPIGSAATPLEIPTRRTASVLHPLAPPYPATPSPSTLPPSPSHASRLSAHRSLSLSSSFPSLPSPPFSFSHTHTITPSPLLSHSYRHSQSLSLAGVAPPPVQLATSFDSLHDWVAVKSQQLAQQLNRDTPSKRQP